MRSQHKDWKSGPCRARRKRAHRNRSRSRNRNRNRDRNPNPNPNPNPNFNPPNFNPNPKAHAGTNATIVQGALVLADGEELEQVEVKDDDDATKEKVTPDARTGR